MILLSSSRLRLVSGIAIAVAALLAACASRTDVAPSSVALDRVTLPMPDGPARSHNAWPQEDWWTAFGDRQLDRLIEHALAASPTLASARARIARAQAAGDLARAANGPQINGTIDTSYGRLSENYQVPKPPLGKGGQSVSQGRAALDFGYDLDLWGRNAALIQSAEAQGKAAAYDLAAARLALTVSIARTYAQLAAQHDLYDLLLATRKQRQEIRTLASQRVANGLDTRVEMKQAQSSEAAVRADLVQLVAAMEVTRLQLAMLAGDMPSAAKDIYHPTLATTEFVIPRTLPFGLLGRRPELAAQRERIAAAIGEAQAAKAQFYPNINLAALIGFQSIGLGQLFSAGSLISSAGPAIRLPIFDSGRLGANHAAKVADIDVAIAQYNQSVLAAAQEVAEQITRAASLYQEENATQEALAAAEEAHRFAMLRYRAGLSSYLTVLSAQTQLLAQQRAAAELKAKRMDLQIALLRALGGGFTDGAASAAQQ